MNHEDIKNCTTLRHLKPVHTQCYADNSLMSCDAVHEDGHKFGQCLSCGSFHFLDSCNSRNSKCFKCGDIGYIQSVCNTTVHLAATNVKFCNTDFIKFSVLNDHLSLSTTSKDSVESYSSSELSETQNSCETTVSYVIVPNMESVLNEPGHDRKPNVVLIDADYSIGLLLCNDIFNKFEKTISKESNRDVLSNNIFPHIAFVSCGKLFQSESQVLNDLDFDYNSDYFISSAVYPYYDVTSNVYSRQCEKYILNETTIITWGYNYATLFLGGEDSVGKCVL
ncbi:unnamed protein product [Schistosoma curassoni]|uniref:CCHC-type domain-containing protein n=1 Tax=Schistosoma curassoni TaxID=6186 RepID=A0A183JGA6_9TREM|nr:unnamed protein product [Schistosoma curassoni]